MSNFMTRRQLPIAKENLFAEIQARLCNPFAYTPAHEVLRFMVAFDQLPVENPRKMNADDWALAKKLIVEEYEKEMMPALDALIKNQSMENILAFVDGAIDSVYVIYWALLKMGVPPDDCFSIVQEANMDKLQLDGTYIKDPETGKVKKPVGWEGPERRMMEYLHDRFRNISWTPEGFIVNPVIGRGA